MTLKKELEYREKVRCMKIYLDDEFQHYEPRIKKIYHNKYAWCIEVVGLPLRLVYSLYFREMYIIASNTSPRMDKSTLEIDIKFLNTRRINLINNLFIEYFEDWDLEEGRGL